MLHLTTRQAQLTTFGLERITLKALMRNTAANMQLLKSPSMHYR
jgi:hypothetical protein